MKTLLEKIEVMKAWGAGAAIECSDVGAEEWGAVVEPIEWDWHTFDYRVKPGVATNDSGSCSECDKYDIGCNPYRTGRCISFRRKSNDSKTCKTCASWRTPALVCRVSPEDHTCRYWKPDKCIGPRAPTVEKWYRAWTPAEAVGVVVRERKTGRVRLICGCDNEANYRFGTGEFSVAWAELKERFERLDGSPCGVVEEVTTVWARGKTTAAEIRLEHGHIGEEEDV